MSAAPKTNPDSRDANGRFTPGNAGGPGNPFARQVAALRRALVETLTPDDMREITFALTLRAKGGNVSAAKLLFQYALGKPLASTHPDRLDADEVEAFKANAVNGDVIKAIDATPAAPALTVLRELQPGRAEEFFNELRAENLTRPTVTKREKPAASTPMSAQLGVALTETESIRLVNPPAANGRP